MEEKRPTTGELGVSRPAVERNTEVRTDEQIQEHSKAVVPEDKEALQGNLAEGNDAPS